MKLVIFAVFFALTAADYGTTPARPKSVYGAPPRSPPSDHSASHKKTEYSAPGQANQDMPLMPYSFAWAVKDEPSNNDFSHNENSDGKIVTGSYRVLLPDGRTQIVTYKANENGYVAQVKYQGDAKYPEYKPTYSEGKPAYPEPRKDAMPTYAETAKANADEPVHSVTEPTTSTTSVEPDHTEHSY